MTAFRKHFSAVDSSYSGPGGRIFPAAVWEPCAFSAGTAVQRQVRTLQPCTRMQDRMAGGAAGEPGGGHTGEQSGPRETVLMYLFGALLGLAVVSASLVGPGEETPTPTHLTVMERSAPQNS